MALALKAVGAAFQSAYLPQLLAPVLTYTPETTVTADLSGEFDFKLGLPAAFPPTTANWAWAESIARHAAGWVHATRGTGGIFVFGGMPERPWAVQSLVGGWKGSGHIVEVEYEAGDVLQTLHWYAVASVMVARVPSVNVIRAFTPEDPLSAVDPATYAMAEVP